MALRTTHISFRYFLCLSQTDLRRVRSSLARSNRLHRIRWSPFANILTPLALFILLLPLKVKRLVPISGSGRDRTQSADTKMQPDSGRVYWTCVPKKGYNLCLGCPPLQRAFLKMANANKNSTEPAIQSK